jgi:3-hydroxyisobutyrate dehydrogenase/2-hydroxy-3-oxopropionate reductase
MGITVARKKDNVRSGSYPPDFKLRLADKDLALVAEAAGKAELDLGVTTAAGQRIAEASRAGLGELDYSAVVAHVRGLPAEA